MKNKDSYVVESLSFTYRGSEDKVLESLNFSLEKGKVHLILGDSGSGKSTLINVLSGIIPEHVMGKVGGKFSYKGKDLLEINMQQRASKIGIVFQNPDSAFCTYTVEDELVFPLENLGFTREEIRKRLEELLDLFEIQNLRNKELNRLSGGEKQKVAMASALALNPELIVFDEPTANMDPQSTKEVFEIIRNLKDKDRTILVVEHKVEEILPIVDYIHIVSNKGDIVFSGEKSEGIEFLSKSDEDLQIYMPESIEFSKILSTKNNIRSKEDVVEYLEKNNTGKSIIKKRFAAKETVIEAKNIIFKYGKEKLFEDFNVKIGKGECLAVVGHNGAGKSTLFNILLNLEKKYKGEVSLNNKNIKKINKKSLWNEVGISFQNPEWQFITSSVYDELALSLKNTKLTNEKRDKEIQEFLNFFDLECIKEKNPFLISQGEKRRLSVATVLVAGQEILFLDEPTYGQDERNTRKMMKKVKSLQKQGMTVIISTHDMGLLWEFCDRTVVMQKGKIILDSSPEELFNNSEVLQKARLSTPFWYDVSKELATKLNRNIDICSKEEAYEFTAL